MRKKGEFDDFIFGEDSYPVKDPSEDLYNNIGVSIFILLFVGFLVVCLLDYLFDKNQAWSSIYFDYSLTGMIFGFPLLFLIIKIVLYFKNDFKNEWWWL